MQEAAAHFIGEHDFRNFCKVDAEHVKNFVRTILDFRVKLVRPPGTDGRALYALHIAGTAFLWHQVSLPLGVNIALSSHVCVLQQKCAVRNVLSILVATAVVVLSCHSRRGRA